MRYLLVLLGLLAGALSTPAYAQGTASVVATCGTPNTTYAAGTTKPVTQGTDGQLCANVSVVATATTTATASATPTAVLAGTGKPMNISLNSELFASLSVGGQLVDASHGLPVICESGCSGGPADETAFTPGTTPSLLIAGFFQTTATNNALTNLQGGAPQMTATRALFSNLRNAAGVEIGTPTTPLSSIPGQSAAAGDALAPVISGAAEGSHVLKAGAGNLYDGYVTAGGTGGYLMIFNATSAPADGAVTPQDCIQVAANTTQSLTTAGAPPEPFSTGITVVFSTTGCFTKTVSATAFFHGRVK